MVLRSFSFSIGFIAFIIVFGFLRGLSTGEIINFQSLLIVLGGMLLVAWIGFPPELLGNTMSAIRRSFQTREHDSETMLLYDILGLADTYRRHGPRALEKASKKTEDAFLRFGTTLIAEGYDEWSLVAALERENIRRHSIRTAQIRFLKTLTRLAPALGMAGTVISLMQVMKELGSTANLGQSLGLALSSTLYGLILANLCLLPLSAKLEEMAQQELLDRTMTIEALEGIRREYHPLRIAERLNAYDIYCGMKGMKTREKDEDTVGAAHSGPGLTMESSA